VAYLLLTDEFLVATVSQVARKIFQLVGAAQGEVRLCSQIKSLDFRIVDE
jgi:hypothetical protein